MADDDDLDDYSYGLGDDDDIEEKPTIILVGLKRFSLFPGVFFFSYSSAFFPTVSHFRSKPGKEGVGSKSSFRGNYSFQILE